MDSLLSMVGILIGIGLISVLVDSFLTFDQLVKLEYNSYMTQWESDGKPHGFFWFPSEYWKSQGMGWFSKWKSQYKSNWAMQRSHLTWLFSTPQWIKEDDAARKLIKRLRV